MSTLTVLPPPLAPYDTPALREFAIFLAREMEFATETARSRPASWYREQIGFELCTEERGDELRNMTIVACHVWETRGLAGAAYSSRELASLDRAERACRRGFSDLPGRVDTGVARYGRLRRGWNRLALRVCEGIGWVLAAWGALAVHRPQAREVSRLGGMEW